MKKHFIRAICILGVLVVLFSCCPLSAFAVDPVSASVIANSFAQAIAAYGASNGVAMTFDVSSTEGIGETVHELWKDFREGTQTADDYDTLAAALFPDLYYKALNAVGTAAEAYSVGVNITSEYAEEFDSFYNWLLSGPAEMVQVDNQYYQFSQSQVGPESTPISVYSSYTPNSFPNQPIPQNSDLGNLAYNNGFKLCGSMSSTVVLRALSNTTAQCYVCLINDGGVYKPVAFSNSSSGRVIFGVYDYASRKDYSYRYTSTRYQNTDWYYSSYSDLNSGWWLQINTAYAASSNVQVYNDVATAIYNLGLSVSPEVLDSVGVKAYDSVGVAEFPDTADPNYDATHRAKSIPLDIPWDDTLFGDGTGDLTDAQSGAIAGEVADVLAADEVIPLVGEAEAVNPRPDPDDDDASGDPDDYAVLGLEDIFPFCIPFDIYAFLSALASDPVAPSFTCTFDFPEALGGTQTLELDFDTPTFNQLAQLLRLLELLAFIVGLALLTRSMFIRG